MLVRQTHVFRQWHEGLADERAQRRIAARISRIRDGLVGDARSLGGGLAELKIDYGPGYRLYYVVRGREMIVLLCGGDKSTQPRDIAKARGLLATLEQ